MRLKLISNGDAVATELELPYPEKSRVAKKVCILGATFTTGNMGVSMLASGTIQGILNQFPNAEIVLLDYGREGYTFEFPFGNHPVSIQFLNIRFSKKIYLANNIAVLLLLIVLSKAIPAGPLRRRFLSSNPSLKVLQETDLVCSIAGGDSFSDIYGIGRFLYVSLPQLLAVWAGKRFICMPQTFGPFRARWVQWMARYILNRSEIVFSRDAQGVESVKGFLGAPEKDSHVRFCYDVAFDVDPVPPARLDIEGFTLGERTSPVVGINVSGLLLAGGYTQNNMFGLEASYEELVYRLIQFFVEDKSASVLLIPHVFGALGDVDSDTTACRTIFEKLRDRSEGRIGWARGEYSHTEIKHIIGQCDFFAGARMHACIGAISQTVPTLSIAYSDKFGGMMKALGLADCAVDPRHMSVEESLQVAARAYERREDIRRVLSAKIPQVKNSIRESLRAIARTAA